MLPPERSTPLPRPARGIRRELARKAFHMSSVSLPVLAWLLPGAWAAILLVPLAAVAVATDWTRLRFRGPRYHFLRHTRTMLRPHERHRFAGATYMAVAYAAAILLFPRPVAIVAMLYNGLGDAAAALVGKRFGRHRTSWGKSWEGFGAALAVNLAVGFVVPGLTPPAAVCGAIAGAVLEFLPLPLDDNLRVCLGGGAAAWAAGVLL
ncbi:MAG TPA: SEC59/DGK1/VTE5 family protein [Longimicrobium sp.]|jgi:dolichol kinase